MRELFDALHVYRYLAPARNRGPTPALAEAMLKLADREIKAGRMLDNGGLMPVSLGAQVKVSGGKLSVVDGPFVEAKELIGGYAIFELRDKEEAVAAAVEFMQLHKEHMPGLGRHLRGPRVCNARRNVVPNKRAGSLVKRALRRRP